MLSPVLAYFLFCRYCAQNMDSPLHTLQVPQRIRMESQIHLGDVTAFRQWCVAFVRPAAVVEGHPLSLAMHARLCEAMGLLMAAHERWRAENPQRANVPWDALPAADRSAESAVREQGGPAWVRAQSVFLLRQQYAALSCFYGRSATADDFETRRLDILCPFIDSAAIVDHFNRHRRATRGSTVGRVVSVNTAAPPATDNGPDNGAARVGGQQVGLSLRMHLDTGLVRTILREVTGVDPYGNHLIGFTLIAPDQPVVDNRNVTALMLSHAMEHIVDDWFLRFGVPLPYHSHVNSAAVQRAIQAVAAVVPAKDDGGGCCLPSGNNVGATPYHFEGQWSRTHPECQPRTPGGFPLYRCVGLPSVVSPPVGAAVGVDDAAFSWASIPQRLALHETYRLAFESPGWPTPVVLPGDGVPDALREACVYSEKEALSLIMAEQFYHSSRLQQIINENRCQAVDHGFAEAGRWHALCDAAELRTRMLKTAGVSPHFYLGVDSPIALFP